MKRLLFIFLTFCHLSCTDQGQGQDEPLEESQRMISYLALGDSYTIGQGVSILERWPNQLILRLEENNFKVDRFQIIAQTGWTTENLITAIDKSEFEDFDLVSLLIGVNNQFQNLDFSVFTNQFNQLLDTAIQVAGGKKGVFVVSIPDYGVTPFGRTNSEQIAEELDEYNAYIADRCQTLGVTYFDITEISRELSDSPGALAADNLHPSGEQYQAWVDIISPRILELLNE